MPLELLDHFSRKINRDDVFDLGGDQERERSRPRGHVEDMRTIGQTSESQCVASILLEDGSDFLCVAGGDVIPDIGH